MATSRGRDARELGDVMERTPDTEELPIDAPILRYVVNVQSEGTSLLAYSLGRDIDKLEVKDDEGNIQVIHEQAFELIKQVKPTSPTTVREIEGLTKLYVQHILYIEETNYQLLRSNDE